MIRLGDKYYYNVGLFLEDVKVLTVTLEFNAYASPPYTAKRLVALQLTKLTSGNTGM